MEMTNKTLLWQGALGAVHTGNHMQIKVKDLKVWATQNLYTMPKEVTDTAQGSHTSLLYSLSTELSEASMHAEELFI